MKVIAIFQFYLSYVLPRASDWPESYLGIKLREFAIGLRPRLPMDPLFPSEVDQTLSGMELQLTRLTEPSARARIVVRDRCLDRVEARVESIVESAEAVQAPEVQSRFLDAAIRACNLFLDHCRVAARSPFVSGIERHYRVEDKQLYMLTPYTVSWFNGENGERLPAYKGNVNAQASSGAIQSPERGTVTINAVIESLKRGESPNLAVSLLVGAEGAIRTLLIREAIISLGTACEIASNEYIRARGRTDGHDVDSILDGRASFAEKRFHLIPRLLEGRSLRDDHPDTFKLAEDMYRAANKLRHEGRAYYEEGGIEIPVDQVLATNFLAAAETAIGWLAK